MRPERVKGGCKVAHRNLTPPDYYTTLVDDEVRNIAELARWLKGLDGAVYVDVASALRRAALGPVPLYPPTVDVHPMGSGYRVIAGALARAVLPYLPPPPTAGLHMVRVPDTDGVALVLVRDGGVWCSDFPDLAAANGWRVDPATMRPLSARDLAQLPLKGVVKGVAPDRFGPRPDRGPGSVMP